MVAIATGIIAYLILSHGSGAGLDRTEGAPTGAPFFVGAAMPRPDTGTRSPEAAAPAGARATIDAIPARPGDDDVPARFPHRRLRPRTRSDEHTSELQSLLRISYAVFCLKKKNKLMK